MARFRLRVGETEVEYEGEPQEVTERFDEAMSWVRGSTPPTHETSSESEKKTTFKKTGESKVIEERLGGMKKEGYFDSPKELSDIRSEMKTRGWYHDSPAVQAVLLRRSASLGIKRISEGGKYRYVRI